MDLVLCRNDFLPGAYDTIDNAEILSGRLPMEGFRPPIEEPDLSRLEEERTTRRFGGFTIVMTDPVNWDDVYDSTVSANFTRGGRLWSVRVQNVHPLLESTGGRLHNEPLVSTLARDTMDFFDTGALAARCTEVRMNRWKAQRAAGLMISRTVAARAKNLATT